MIYILKYMKFPYKISVFWQKSNRFALEQIHVGECGLLGVPPQHKCALFSADLREVEPLLVVVLRALRDLTGWTSPARLGHEHFADLRNQLCKNQ